jgi:hypothetical protein
MAETCFIETSVDFQRTKRRYIPEDRTLHNHRCDNLSSSMYNIWSSQGSIKVIGLLGCSAMYFDRELTTFVASIFRVKIDLLDSSITSLRTYEKNLRHIREVSIHEKLKCLPVCIVY